MKKKLAYIVTVCLLILSPKTIAQNAFKSLEEDKYIQSISIDKKMFEMITNVKIDLSNPTDAAYYNLVKKLDLLKVLTTSNPETGKRLLDAAQLVINEQQLQKVDLKNSQFEKADIYIKPENKNSDINHLILISQEKGSNNLSVLYISGTFLLEELYLITEKMNIPTFWN